MMRTPLYCNATSKYLSQGNYHDCSYPTHQLLRGSHLGHPQLLARTVRRPWRLRSGSAGLICTRSNTLPSPWPSSPWLRASPWSCRVRQKARSRPCNTGPHCGAPAPQCPLRIGRRPYLRTAGACLYSKKNLSHSADLMSACARMHAHFSRALLATKPLLHSSDSTCEHLHLPCLRPPSPH